MVFTKQTWILFFVGLVTCLFVADVGFEKVKEYVKSGIFGSNSYNELLGSLEGNEGFGCADYFLVGKDFPSYIECQEKVDEAYQDQKGCPVYKPCELIDALSLFLPYPPKANAAATLSNVIDYIKITQEEIKQLEEIRSQQLSQFTAGTKYQATAGQGNIILLPGSPVDRLIEIPNQMGGTNHAAQGNNIPLPGSPIDGLIEMPNQMVGTNDVVPATSFPVNKADVAVVAAVNQAANAGTVNQATDAAAVNQTAVVNQPPDAASVVNYQPCVLNEDPDVLVTREKISAFTELMDRLSYP